MHEFDLQPLLSGLAGSALVGFLVKAMISEKLAELDEALRKIIELQQEMARVAVKLESFERTQESFRRIDRKVAQLEMKVYGANPQLNGLDHA